MTQPPARPPFPPPHPMRLPGPVPPRPAPRRGVVAGVLAGMFALAAAGLSIGGVFAVVHTLSNTHRDDSGANFGYDITWWGRKYPRGSEFVQNQDSLSGLAPLSAAAILLLGAVFVFVAANSGRLLTASRSVLSLGSGLLAGAVFLQLLGTLQDMSVWNEEELDPGESIEFTASLGLWLPLGGVLLAAVAAVLAHVGRRAAAVRVEPNTPRMGFPMPYGPGGPVPGQQPTGPGQPGHSTGQYQAVGTSTGQHPVVGAPAEQPPSPPEASAVGPDAPTVAPPAVGAEAAAAHAAAPIASRLDDESTPDADITQRTTVMPPPAPPAPDAPTVAPPPARSQAPAASAPEAAPASEASAARRTPPAPAAAVSPTVPAPPAVSATPTPPSPPAEPAAPASPAPSTEPASPEPATEAAPPATPAPSTSDTPADQPAPGSSGLLNLPAAPPAPELAAEEKKKGK
ncbi:MAG: hypothetical protein GEV28_33580 [Actinophytocola sp.]|uniref:hypothetical protein n=1 Tax=Actinophytocola sp. TaxID=1872138 RepID=UPI00132706A3|nr:hypothetical protein [Actinophytocola sp.]MPZ85056.1 hypothetical protein [Actinophytocola sp.]